MFRRLLVLGVAVTIGACGGAPTAPTDVAFSKYGLPVNLSQIDTTSSMLLWPYGVQGGDHPNGHPGIDFTLQVGADVLADQSGKVIDITNSVFAGEVGITVRHEDGWKSFFTGFFQTVIVSKGQSVSRGQVIAKVDRWNGAGAASYHWGIAVDDKSEAVSCPGEFVSADDRAAMQRLLDNSSFPDKARYPLVCNPCPAGGCR